MSIYVQKNKGGLLEFGAIPPPFLLSNEIISKFNLLRRLNMCYSKMASEMKESTVIVVQNAWSSNSHCEPLTCPSTLRIRAHASDYALPGHSARCWSLSGHH